MANRRKILLVNDDGVHAPGLRHLYDALSSSADLTVVAPTAQQSGKGVSISMYRPLQLNSNCWGLEYEAHCLTGTPADCVRIALAEVIETPPDLILSGINPGRNAGAEILYSGTVGAAIEGVLHGIPSMAISINSCKDPSYAHTTEMLPKLLDLALESGLPDGTLLNVNFPEGKYHGVRVARQGRGYYRETPERRRHPEGHDYFWLGGAHWETDEHEESDVALLEQGFVTIVPLRATELTCHATLERVRADVASRFS